MDPDENMQVLKSPQRKQINFKDLQGSKESQSLLEQIWAKLMNTNDGGWGITK